ncbi:MAG: hypothetical protein AB7U25_11880 [Vicinamibacterales bacterium]
MAERPIFLPSPETSELVKEVYVDFQWHPGFAPVQKRKNVAALHAAAAKSGYAPLLEISTKSEEKLGRHLSAFHLKVPSASLGPIPLEVAFQGSKVFERGGPYTDLYSVDAREAKRDPRLKESGRLLEFRFGSVSFHTEPKTAFYDWLYVSAIFPHRDWLERLTRYAGFSDIEFNPQRSINCQARSCALFVALMRRNVLSEAVESPQAFVHYLSREAYRPELREAPAPEPDPLFSGNR